MMVRIAITQAAYDAICATLPLGSVAVEPYYNERGERLIWLRTRPAEVIVQSCQSAFISWGGSNAQIPRACPE
jgi:hypothetical protein